MYYSITLYINNSTKPLNFKLTFVPVVGDELFIEKINVKIYKRRIPINGKNKILLHGTSIKSKE